MRRSNDFDNFVHVGETWLYLYVEGQRFCLFYDNEQPLVRKTQSKRFITKVTCLVAVALPRRNNDTNSCFNGKIALWHFVERSPAQRASRNRQRGELVTRCVEVSKESYKEMLIDNVIPAIMARWD